MYSVYIITNIVNSKKYIGYTSVDIAKRMNEHFLCAGKKGDTKFYRAIRKYGTKSFKTELLESFDTKESALRAEIEYIDKLNTIKKGYNTHEGGKGGNTGAYHKVNKKVSGNLNGMFGKKHTIETLIKIKTKANIWRESKQGIQFRKESSDRWKQNNPGKNKTEETKNKISLKLKGRTPSVVTTCFVIFPCGKREKVINLTNFCKANNLTQGNASKTLNGIYKSCKGFKFTKI